MPTAPDSQLICAQVEDPNDVVDVGQKVYVKVVEHRENDKMNVRNLVIPSCVF